MRPYRNEKLASLVHEIVSEAISCHLQDPRIEALTTVTRVEVSGDLQVAKVFLSIPGGEVPERRTLQAVRHAGGFIQRMVAGQLSVRQCPELRFDIDTAAKVAKRTLDLLAENRRKDPSLTLSAGDVDDEFEAFPGEPGRAAGGETESDDA